MDLDRPSLLSRLSISSAQSVGSVSSWSTTRSTVAGGHRRDMRIIQSSDLKDTFHSGVRKDEVESLLSKIDKIYGQVKLEAGEVGNVCSCLGLLDPVANIRLNRFFARRCVLPPADGGQGPDKDMMAQRSLDGLVAFLTRLFPYLPDREAMAYLDAAAADPLVATVLVVNSRALSIDSFTSASVEVALRSAAVAAKHPDPELFIREWKVASLSAEKVAAELSSNKKRVSEKALYFFVDLPLLEPPMGDLQLEDWWKLAKDRLSGGTKRAILKGGHLPPARGAMKRCLLSVIHGYYLKALAILPKKELTESYHRSLLIAGHCYGPLDPVSNIIVNTIWYEQRFPSAVKVQPLNMISTDCLWRIAARSLYGLVAFLCNRNKKLTPDMALHDLLNARGNLTLADPQELSDNDSKKTGRHSGATLCQAYLAAARSAKHPRASSQADFLGEPKSVRKIEAFSEALELHVREGSTLTKETLGFLHMGLRCPSSAGLPQLDGKDPEKLSHDIYLNYCTAKKEFWRKHQRVTSMVEAALNKFNKNSVHKYNLHIICGVNELVKREFSLDSEVEVYNPSTPYKYHYSHINFLATSETSGTPKLFFAECSNHGMGTSCVLMDHIDDGIFARCIYCEHETNRICHPTAHNFIGRDDFEVTRDYYSNDKVQLAQGYLADWIYEVKEDVIYANFCDGGYEDLRVIKFEGELQDV